MMLTAGKNQKTVSMAVFFLLLICAESISAGDMTDQLLHHTPPASREAHKEDGPDIDLSSGQYIVYWEEPDLELDKYLYQLQESVDNGPWHTVKYTSDRFYMPLSLGPSGSFYRYRVRLVSSVLALTYRWATLTVPLPGARLVGYGMITFGAGLGAADFIQGLNAGIQDIGTVSGAFNDFQDSLITVRPTPLSYSL